MKSLFRIVMVVGTFGLFVAASLPAIDSIAEKEVRAAEQQMHDAYVKHDVPLFASLYAEDSTFTHSTGRTVGKAERVKGFTRPFTGLEDTVQQVRVWGDTAIVNCKSVYPSSDGKGTVRIQITRVWLKRGGKWQVVAFQSTPIAEGEHP